MLNSQMKKQVKAVICTVLILSAVFAVILGALSFVLDFSVKAALLGTALGAAAACASFFILALNVQHSVERSAKGAQLSMGFGYLFRLAIAGLVIILAIKLPMVFNVWTTAIPLVFPRLAIFIINFTQKGGDNA